MQSYTKFEEEIKNEFLKKTAGVNPSEDMFSNIKMQIEKEERGIVMNTRNIKKSRGVLVACMILILTTVTCFAAVRIASYTSHGTNNDFESYPSAEKMQKEAGFLPDYLENFSNGFTFKSGGVGEVASNDEEGNVIDKVKMTNLSYEKGDKSVALSVEDGILSDQEEAVTVVNITKELTGTYTEFMNKMVPPDYVQTEQDKIDEANGTLIFSYGSSEVETLHVQAVSWNKDGMRYSLMSMDDGVTEDELIAMATEVAEVK